MQNVQAYAERAGQASTSFDRFGRRLAVFTAAAACVLMLSACDGKRGASDNDVRAAEAAAQAERSRAEAARYNATGAESWRQMVQTVAPPAAFSISLVALLSFLFLFFRRILKFKERAMDIVFDALKADAISQERALLVLDSILNRGWRGGGGGPALATPSTPKPNLGRGATIIDMASGDPPVGPTR